MSDRPAKHRYIRRLAILLTERCSARCRCCVYGLGGQGGSTDDVPAHLLRSWMAQGVAAGIREFCFTGGEPFLAYESLREGVWAAAQLGAQAGVITNASWAVTPEAAYRMLEPLAGLGELSISADRYHQEFIPLARVRHALAAARALGIAVRIKVVYTDEAEVVQLKAALAGLIAPNEVDADQLRNVGRMAQDRGQPAPAMPPDLLQIGCPMTGAPTIVPSGGVCGCCGPLLTLAHDHPFWLGSLAHQDLTQVLAAAELNAAYQIVRLRGPYALYREVAPVLRGWHPDLSSACSLCSSLFGNPQAVAALTDLTRRPALVREVAVERLLFFGEAAMLARL